MLSRLASNGAPQLRHAFPAAAPVVTVSIRQMSGFDNKRLLLDVQTARAAHRMKTPIFVQFFQKLRHKLTRSPKNPRMPDFEVYPDPVKTLDSRTSPIDWSMSSIPPEEEILTGDELLEHELNKQRKKITLAGAAYGPFGTPEKPVIIPTFNKSRIAGCVGGVGKEHELVYFMIHADEPKVRCPRCDQVFQLVVHQDDHHEHTLADDIVHSYEDRFGKILQPPGHGHDHGHGDGHDQGVDHQHERGLGPDPKQHVH